MTSRGRLELWGAAVVGGVLRALKYAWSTRQTEGMCVSEWGARGGSRGGLVQPTSFELALLDLRRRGTPDGPTLTARRLDYRSPTPGSRYCY